MSAAADPVPDRFRRQSIALLPVATALLVAGVLPAVLAGSVWARVVGVVVALAAVLLLGVALGLGRLARAAQDTLDAAAAEAELDAAIIAATAGSDGACGDGGCSTCASDCAVKSLPRS